MQIGEHEIKTVKFPDNTTIFLRYITFLNKIQRILKRYENTEINQFKRYFFQKGKPLWAGAYKNRIDQPGQLEQSQLPLKYLKLILVNLFSVTPDAKK